jgi:hypothetical protein
MIALYIHVHQCSSGSSKAEWHVNCLWFMHLKDPLGSFEMCREISPVPGFQFWLNKWHAWVNAEEEENEPKLWIDCALVVQELVKRMSVVG